MLITKRYLDEPTFRVFYAAPENDDGSSTGAGSTQPSEKTESSGETKSSSSSSSSLPTVNLPSVTTPDFIKDNSKEGIGSEISGAGKKTGSTSKTNSSTSTSVDRDKYQQDLDNYNSAKETYDGIVSNNADIDDQIKQYQDERAEILARQNEVAEGNFFQKLGSVFSGQAGEDNDRYVELNSLINDLDKSKTTVNDDLMAGLAAPNISDYTTTTTIPGTETYTPAPLSKEEFQKSLSGVSGDMAQNVIGSGFGQTITNPNSNIPETTSTLGGGGASTHDTTTGNANVPTSTSIPTGGYNSGANAEFEAGTDKRYVGYGVDPNATDYNIDNWNVGMTNVSDVAVSDENCKRFIKSSYKEDPVLKKVYLKIKG